MRRCHKNFRINAFFFQYLFTRGNLVVLSLKIQTGEFTAEINIQNPPIPSFIKMLIAMLSDYPAAMVKFIDNSPKIGITWIFEQFRVLIVRNYRQKRLCVVPFKKFSLPKKKFFNFIILKYVSN